MKISFIKTSIANLAGAITALLIVGVTPLSAATLGVWEYHGFITAEENEGAGAAYSSSVTMNQNGEDVYLALSCGVANQEIGLSMGGRENFEQAAQNAIMATMGKIDPGVSYLDMDIDYQIFSLKSMVYDISGELAFIDNFPANGSVITALLQGSYAELKAPGLRIQIPLINSANAICRTLRQCGALQSYCINSGR